jgi:hypothetical protein
MDRTIGVHLQLLVSSWNSFPLGVGQLELFVWGQAWCLPNQEHSNFTVIETENSGRIRQVSLNTAQVNELLGRLRQLGFPKQVPRVRGIADTSDVGSHIQLVVDLDGQRSILDLQLMASGYDGADARLLRDLFERLLIIFELDNEYLRHRLLSARTE